MTVLPDASASVLANGETPAEWWQRALAALMDAGLLVGVVLIAALGAALITSMDPEAGVLAALIVIAAYLFGPVYYVHHHAVHGQTVGKSVIGIYVCDEQTGEVIGYGRGFLRWLLPVIMTAALYVPGLLNILWPLWDSKKQALHDKAVHTAVVMGHPARGSLFEVCKRHNTLCVPSSAVSKDTRDSDEVLSKKNAS